MTEKATLNYLSWVGLPAPAVDPNHAVRKKEVDDAVSELQTQIDGMENKYFHVEYWNISDFDNLTNYTIIHNLGHYKYGVEIWFYKAGHHVSQYETSSGSGVYFKPEDLFVILKRNNDVVITPLKGKYSGSLPVRVIVREY